MTVPDFPPGEWSPLLVGAQWVSGTTLTILTNALANRRATVSNFSNLHETLQSALNSTIAGQEGATADAIRNAFHQGADQSFQVAEKNDAYAKALQHAHNSVIALRHLLTDIAERGNKEINDIESSKADLETKVAKISEVIADCQREANQKAAGCADDIMEAGQNVFAAQGIGESFRGLAHGNSVDSLNRQPDLNAIEDQVRGKLDQPTRPTPPGAPSGSGSLSGGGAGRGSEAPAAPPAPAAAGSPSAGGSSPASGSAGLGAQAPAAPFAPAAAGSPSAGGSAGLGAQAPAAPFAPAAAGSPPALGAARGGLPAPVAPAHAAGGGGSPHLSAPNLPAPPGLPTAPGLPTSSMPSPLSSPATGMPGGLAPANPTSSGSLGAHTGSQGGAASASGSASPPTAPVQAADSAAQQAQQASQAASTFPSAGAGAQAAAQDMPSSVSHASASHVAPPPVAYSPEPRSPTVTGPPAGAVSASPAPASPLQAYGADLRPPAAATPTAPMGQPPPPPSASTASGWAPVNPSAAAQIGAGQAAVASQSGSSAPLHAQPGMGPQVVMATASGAMAGAMSADATARGRLQRLLAVVARQQPLLAWAIGDRPDGTTVLVTDLASGWIPTGVDLPAAVTLLEPARRRGDIQALLGEVDPVVTSTPGHYLSQPDNDEPVATSSRPRQAPEVEEMCWQLTDATHWRDGLPRLAHTLAKAASRGTGVLESEAEQLHNELTVLGDRVVDSYPNSVDAAAVGNWQLLAAIEALVTDDWNAANYHLAWFLACNTAEAESVAR
jgi:uncharacterized protein DUF5632/uncharacterized protein DUF5631